MSNTDYLPPINFDERLADIRARALKDAELADALRNIPVLPREYARGLLAGLGLSRLGDDYVISERSLAISSDAVSKAIDRAAQIGPTTQDAVAEFLGYSETPEIRAARDRYFEEWARDQAIIALVDQIAAAGETPDYDGAPC